MVYMSRRYLASAYNVFFLNTLPEMWLFLHTELSSFKCQCLSGVHRGLVRSSTPLLEQCFVTGGEDGLLCLWRAEAKANPSGAVKVRPSTGPQIKRSRVTWGWRGRGVVHHQLATMATTRCVKRKMHQNETGQVWSWVAWRTPGNSWFGGTQASAFWRSRSCSGKSTCESARGHSPSHWCRNSWTCGKESCCFPNRAASRKKSSVASDPCQSLAIYPILTVSFREVLHNE